MAGDHKPGFYLYKGTETLENEPAGSSRKTIWNDVKTQRAARIRAALLMGREKYRLYYFTNFYDPSTFKQIGTNVSG